MTQSVNDPAVTIIVSRRVLAVNRDRFEAALHTLTETSLTFPGHLGVTVVRPTGNDTTYRILFRFEHKSQYDRWQADAAIQALIAGADALTEGEASVTTLTGMEAWFDPPPAGTKPPSRHKMALLTWTALFPVVSLILTALGRLDLHAPFLVNSALVTGCATLIMTYLVMPRLTRLVARWLY